MYSETQGLSHMLLQKPEDWKAGIQMYLSQTHELMEAAVSETDALLHTEYGPHICIAFIGLLAMVLATSYDASPDIPLEIVERVVACHETFPLGSQICTTPRVLLEQLTR